MVHVSDGEGKSLVTKMAELQQHRKMLHRSFTRKSDGDTYVALMFVHNEHDELCIVYALTALPQIKEVLPIGLFQYEFDQQIEHVQPNIKRAKV